jgi:hypothetical protein
MVSPYYFIVKPLNGKRYDSEKQYGDKTFVVSSSQEDHTVTNRFAVVEELPLNYNGFIEKGDIVIVHHNVFRIYYDTKGRERSSWNFFEDDIFMIEYDQIYLYKGEDEEWKSPYPYCFVEPIMNEAGDITAEKELYGVIKYVPENDYNINPGDNISFRPDSEYEFRIDDKKLYRMKLANLCLRV